MTGCAPGRAGISHADQDLTRWLRDNVQVPLVLAANKAEHSQGRGTSALPDKSCGLFALSAVAPDGSSGAEVQETLDEATRLGLGEPVAISAATGEGMADLYLAVQPIFDARIQERRQEVEQQKEPAEPVGERIGVAVVGLPNAVRHATESSAASACHQAEREVRPCRESRRS